METVRWPLEKERRGEEKVNGKRWWRWNKKNEAGDNQQSLGVFATIEPEGLNTVTEGEWEEIEMAVDSGATETVVGEESLKGIEIREGVAFKRGVKYEIANGVRIPNLGEKSFVGVTEEGIKRGMTAQVCEVNKALLSVSKTVAAGNRVVFGPEGAYIQNVETREKLWLQEKGGMYMLKMWVQNKKGF